jgi:hypothetical protein
MRFSDLFGIQLTRTALAQRSSCDSGLCGKRHNGNALFGFNIIQ